MRISDWSSDVCSSDLLPQLHQRLGRLTRWPTDTMSRGAASWSSRARRCLAACAARAALALLPSLPATAKQHTSETDPRTECWRGFGCLLDGASGGYTRPEMLQVNMATQGSEVGGARRQARGGR